jgi:hypothetical protein
MRYGGLSHRTCDPLDIASLASRASITTAGHAAGIESGARQRLAPSARHATADIGLAGPSGFARAQADVRPIALLADDGEKRIRPHLPD